MKESEAMKIAKLALAAAISLATFGLPAAPALAQQGYHHNDRHHARHARPHRVRVCRTVWRHHHRQRVCHWAWRR
jgi:hypothetical protein